MLGDEIGTTVGTVEHLLAALRGLAVDNCYIEIDGKEVPTFAAVKLALIDRKPGDTVALRSTRTSRRSCGRR